MKYLAFLGCFAVLLGGCSTLPHLDLPRFDLTRDGRVTTTTNGSCPAVSRVAELASQYQFVDPARPDPAELMAEAHMTRVESRCKKQGSDLTLDVALVFEHGLGPKGRIRPGDKPTFALPYFVAVVDHADQILAKDIFVVSFNYDADDQNLLQTENVRLTAPIGGRDPRSVRLLIGLQLEPSDLVYNRTLPDTALGRSLTLP